MNKQISRRRRLSQTGLEQSTTASPARRPVIRDADGHDLVTESEQTTTTSSGSREIYENHEHSNLSGKNPVDPQRESRKQQNLQQLIDAAQPGDLIVIKRSGYKHMTLYIGYCPTCQQGLCVDFAGPGGFSLSASSGDSIKAVKTLSEVLGNDKGRIKNYDENALQIHNVRPKPVREIVQTALQMIESDVHYDLFENNCEHACMKARFGIKFSPQVRSTVLIVVAGLGFAGFLVFIVKLWNNPQRRRN